MSTIRTSDFRRLWVQGAALAALLATPAFAQDPAQAAAGEAAGEAVDASGDIIVTATRRSESIQKVPIAVSVIDGELMRQQGLANLKDISGQVPTLNFRTAASNKDQAVFVRGLGTVSTSPGVEEFRETVRSALREVMFSEASLDVLLAYAEIPEGQGDAEVLRLALEMLPARSPKRCLRLPSASSPLFLPLSPITSSLPMPAR